MTVIYIDILFLINLIANYLLLLGAGRMSGVTLQRWRIVLGAMTGAVYAVAVVLPDATWFAHLPYKLLCGILMCVISFGACRKLLRVTVFFFAASAGLAGLILAMGEMGVGELMLKSGVVYSELNLRLLLLSFVTCYFVMSLLFRRTGIHCKNELIRMEIVTGGEKISLTALLDSGHTLTDPANNAPVVVAEWELFSDKLPQGVDPLRPVEGLKQCRSAGMQSVRLIPYRAVGVDCGMLLAVRANSVKAGGKELGELLIALSPTPVSDGGTYQALIGRI